MWHVNSLKILTHCKLIPGALFTYLQTDIWNGFPQRSALKVLQYIFSYLFLYISTQFSKYYSLEIHDWFLKCTVYNLQECLRLNNQCYFFSSFYKNIEVNFHVRNFDNIEVESFHKHFWMYWSCKETSRCRNCCPLYGTWLWVVKKHIRHEWFPIFCRMTYFAT